MNDPKDTRWEYTYHGRLARYGSWKELTDAKEGKSIGVGFKIDQIENVIKKLVDQPFTRQAQMITWMPNMDINVYDPPCLQSLWYRILEDNEEIQWLNCVSAETMWFIGNKEAALFIGLWVPSILGFAIYLKLLKIEKK